MQKERSKTKEDSDNQIEEFEPSNKEYLKVENTSGSVVLLRYAILSFICILGNNYFVYSLIYMIMLIYFYSILIKIIFNCQL